MVTRRGRCVAGATCLVALLVFDSRDASAEPSSWLALGPGLSLQHDSLDKREAAAFAVSGEVGVGSDPSHPFVVGGTFRALYGGGFGMDVSASARVATAGFVLGGWGAALDVGVVGRWWGRQEFGHFPFQAVGIVGFPAGLQLELGADLGDVTGDSPGARGGFAILGVDIFRVASRTSGSQKGFWSQPPPQMQVTEHNF